MVYDAICFDNDGVLTTPTDRSVLERAIEAGFASVSVHDPDREAISTLVSPTVTSLLATARRYDVDPATLWRAREREAIEAQHREMRRGRKRPYDDVQTIESVALPRAIVSNNQHGTIEHILREFDLPAFEVVYGREPTIQGIGRKKPAPYYLERAIEDLGATRPLFVGDSRVDIQAARAIDVDSVFLRRDHRQGYHLPHEPTYEISSMAELPSVVETTSSPA